MANECRCIGRQFNTFLAWKLAWDYFFILLHVHNTILLNFLSVGISSKNSSWKFSIELGPRFEKKKDERGVNQRHYVEVMDTVVWPWIEETYGDKDIVYCFQQVLWDARLDLESLTNGM